MGTTQKIMSGARAALYLNDANGNSQLVGLFTTASWALNYDAQANYILGRYSPAEITYTGQEAVTVNCSGFRVVNNDPYEAALVPHLQDLLTHQDISISIYDRQTGVEIMNVVGVRPTGFNSDVAARAIAGLSVSFMGLRITSESNPQDGESPGASNLPGNS